ncbi:MAG: flagellar basal body P-ring formation chaperone FlgA [Chthonomonadales bacterium]
MMPCISILLLTALLSPSQGPGVQHSLPPRRTAAKVRVVILPDPVVSGSVFTLGEIARVTGSNAQLVARISAVEVGASPLPGLTRLLFPADVQTRLRYNGIDPGAVDLQAPPSIRVSRAATRVDNSAVVRAATEAVEAANQGGGELIVEASPPSTQLYVSPGSLTYLPGAPRGELGSGSVIVPVAILVDGKPAKSVDVLVKVRRRVTALVATRPLAPHDTLTSGDVTTAVVDGPPGGAPFLTDVAALVGKRTTRQIALGAPLREGDVEAVPVILTGARVNVVISAGGVTITAPAVARTQGAIGDRVRVFVKTTRKELTGTVVDASTVRVEEVP